jgi:hypothetical protein
MRYLINFMMILLLVLCSPVYSATEDEPQLDTDAMAILEEAVNFLESLDSFEIKGKAIFDVIQEDGQRLQFEKSTRVVVQRPDKLYVERVRDDGHVRKFWYDGSQASILNVGKNAYAQLKAPETIDGMLDMFEGLLKEPHPLADLLYSNLDPLLDLPEEAFLVGPSTVGNFVCDHLAFRNADLDWQIWVQNGETPFIRKVVITYRNQPGIPQFVSYLQSWRILGQINQEVFLFTPPENAERLSILLPPVVYADEGGEQ